MAKRRCRNKALIDMVSYKRLDKNIDVAFSVISEIEACDTIVAKRYIEVTGGTAAWNPRNTPEDQLNCDTVGCKTSGTAIVTADAVNTPVGLKYALSTDATDFVAGLLYYYAYFPVAGTYTITSTISDYADMPQTNSDAYEQTITVTEPGFKPIQIDLSKEPTAVNGTGWDATNVGVVLDIEIASSDAEATVTAGVSSISFFTGIEELEAVDTVVLGCVDEFTGEFTADPIDATCFGGTYDESTATIERTLTFHKFTPNIHKLNPYISNGSLVDGWKVNTVDRVVTEITVDGVRYGTVLVNDIYEDHCSFNYAALADNCNVTDAILTQVSSPVALTLNDNQFMIMPGGQYLFNEALIGKVVTIQYPEKAEIIHYVGSREFEDGKRVKMRFGITQTDGVTKMYVYNNVLITSFPDTVGLEEPTMDVTIQMQPDASGKYFDMYQYTD